MELTAYQIKLMYLTVLLCTFCLTCYTGYNIGEHLWPSNQNDMASTATAMTAGAIHNLVLAFFLLGNKLKD